MLAISKTFALYQQNLNNDPTLPKKQKDILQASLKLFAAKGFHDTSTADIAQAAGVAEGTVYKRFKTKDALLSAVLSPLTSTVLAETVAEFSETTLAKEYTTLHAFISDVVTNRLAFVNDNLATIKILVGEAIYNTSIRNQIVSAMQAVLTNQYAHSVKALQQKNLIVDWPIKLIFQYTISSIGGYLVKQITFPKQVNSPDEEAPQVIHFLEKGLAPE
ncbi:hypothetical protein B8A32_07275 [Loigolactobacillus backii]|nr:hypothetical protein B8A32_07275 [Loigolactobacillus backii]